MSARGLIRSGAPSQGPSRSHRYRAEGRPPHAEGSGAHGPAPRAARHAAASTPILPGDGFGGREPSTEDGPIYRGPSICVDPSPSAIRSNMAATLVVGCHRRRSVRNRTIAPSCRTKMRAVARGLRAGPMRSIAPSPVLALAASADPAGVSTPGTRRPAPMLGGPHPCGSWSPTMLNAKSSASPLHLQIGAPLWAPEHKARRRF